MRAVWCGECLPFPFNRSSTLPPSATSPPKSTPAKTSVCAWLLFSPENNNQERPEADLRSFLFCRKLQPHNSA